MSHVSAVCVIALTLVSFGSWTDELLWRDVHALKDPDLWFSL